MSLKVRHFVMQLSINYPLIPPKRVQRRVQRLNVLQFLVIHKTLCLLFV